MQTRDSSFLATLFPRAGKRELMSGYCPLDGRRMTGGERPRLVCCPKQFLPVSRGRLQHVSKPGVILCGGGRGVTDGVFPRPLLQVFDFFLVFPVLRCVGKAHKFGRPVAGMSGLQARVLRVEVA